MTPVWLPAEGSPARIADYLSYRLKNDKKNTKLPPGIAIASTNRPCTNQITRDLVNMIMRLSRFFHLFAALLMLFVVEAQADSLDKILEKGTLRVGVTLFTPWTMQPKSAPLSGYEVDVANKLAYDMGVKAEFTTFKQEEVMQALARGEIDIIAAGLAITPLRALKINFSQPYANSGITLATNTKKTTNVKSLKELNQKQVQIAVVSKAIASEVVGNIFDKATIKAYKTGLEAERAVLTGKAHAYVASSPQPEFLALTHPGEIDIPLSKPLVSYKAGFGVRKGQQELLNYLNAWITARTADKWLPATHKYWFGSLDWKKGAGK